MEVDVTEKAKNFIRFGLIGLIVLAALAGGGLYLYQHSNRGFVVSDAMVVGSESVITAKGDGKITEADQDWIYNPTPDLQHQWWTAVPSSGQLMLMPACSA